MALRKHKVLVAMEVQGMIAVIKVADNKIYDLYTISLYNEFFLAIKGFAVDHGRMIQCETRVGRNQSVHRTSQHWILRVWTEGVSPRRKPARLAPMAGAIRDVKARVI